MDNHLGRRGIFIYPAAEAVRPDVSAAIVGVKPGGHNSVSAI